MIKLIFSKKSCFGAFGQKFAQNEFCEFYDNLMHLIFLIFSIKLQHQKDWKLGKTYFDKIAFSEFCCKKSPKIGLKRAF